MTEKQTLLDLQRAMLTALAKLEDQLKLFDPKGSDEEHEFLIKKMAMYRDNLDAILKRLEELK